MAVETTLYEVRTRFTTEDKASAGMREMDRSAQLASRSIDGLKKHAMGLAGAFGVGLGVKGAKGALIDVNSELEKTRRILGATMEQELGGTFAENLARAEGMVSRIHDATSTSASEMRRLAEASSQIVGPMAEAGRSASEIEKVITQATRLGGGLGADAGRSIQELDQLIEGQVRRRSLIARRVIREMGVARDEIGKMSQEARVGLLVEAFNRPAMQRFIDEMDKGFESTMAEFRNSMERTLAGVGLPLFKRITSELERWNKWIDEHPEKMERFAEQFGGALERGFEVVQGVGEFLVEHKETLLMIARIWAGAKIGGMAGGMIGSVGRGIRALGQKAGGLASGLGAVTDSSALAAGEVGGLGSAANSAAGALDKIGRAAGIAGIGVGVGNEVGEWLIRRKRAEEEQKRGRMDFMNLVHRIESGQVARGLAGSEEQRRLAVEDTMRLRRILASEGILTASGGLHAPALVGFLDRIDALGRGKNQGNIFQIARSLERTAELHSRIIAQGLDLDRPHGPDAPPKRPLHRPVAEVDVKIEVADRDPDRFVHTFERALQEIARNPSQARGALGRL